MKELMHNPESRNPQTGNDDACAARTSKGRRTLLLLLLVSVAPVVAAYIAFYVWRPTSEVNSHGTVVSPVVVLPISGVRTLDNLLISDAIKGKWVLALRAPGTCNKDCQQKLYYMRQIRVIQAANMDRVARLWVTDDFVKPNAAFLSEHPGLLVVNDAAIAAAMGAAGHIALIDPRGNLMMRFPQDPDSKGIVKDLQKLLKYSR